MRDIVNRLVTECFPRLRIGVGPPKENWDVADFVLSKFEKEERSTVESTILRAADAVACFDRPPGLVLLLGDVHFAVAGFDAMVSSISE